MAHARDRAVLPLETRDKLAYALRHDHAAYVVGIPDATWARAMRGALIPLEAVRLCESYLEQKTRRLRA